MLRWKSSLKPTSGGGGSTFPSTSLVGFYKLDEASGADALDSSGNGRTFSDNGTVASTTGTIGGETVNVRTLDRPAGKYFSRTDDADFDVADGEDFTISFWAKASSSMGNYNSGGIFSKRNAVGASDAGYTIALRKVNSDTYVRYNAVCDGTTTVGDTNTSTGVATDAWAHYIMVFTADSTLVTYVNNVQYDSEDVSSVTGALTNAKDNYIGQLAYNSNGDIIADVTHIGFWSIALDATERTSLYNSGKVLAPAASTGITLETSATTTGISYSTPVNIDVNIPAVSADDILLLFCTTANESEPTDSPPSGWTKIGEQDGSSTSGATVAAYWKRASGSASATTETWSAFYPWGETYYIWVGAYSGCATSVSPVDTNAGNALNYGSSVASSFTTNVANTMVVSMAGTFNKSATWSPSGEIVDSNYGGSEYASVSGSIESTAGSKTATATLAGNTRSTILTVALKPAASTNNNFDFTVTTTTSSETFTIICGNFGDTFNATIDWGDGTSTSTITAYNDTDLAHTYALAGDHNISISGTFPNMNFAGTGDVTKIKSVNNMGSIGMTTTYGMLWGATNLTSFTVGDADTSLVTDSHHMFRGCSSLTSLDLSTLDLSNSTTFFNFLRDCSSLTSLDLSSFNSSSATSMSSMFRGCSSLTSLDLSSFNTSSVTSMANMFHVCSSLTSLDLSSFNTGSVTNMRRMFSGMSSSSQATITGIEDFDITSLSSNRLTSFLNSSSLSTTVYDELLVNWEGQTGYNNQNPNFGSSTYTASSAAATARAALVTAGWSITDGGTA